MSRHTISNSDDIIDSRDVIKRISELESELEDRYNEDTEDCGACDGTGEVAADCADETTETVSCEDCNGNGTVARSDSFEDWLKRQADESDDDATELVALRELADEAEGYGDWRHGETLIRDSYFETYAQDLHEDINGRDAKSGWPYDYIDWEAAADALKSDYSSVEFDGETYWMRS